MSIRTNPSKAVPELLNRLRKSIKDSDDVVPSAKEIKQTIDDLLLLFPAVKQWNDKLIECFLNLDRHRPRTESEAFDSSPIQQELNKIKALLLKLETKAENKVQTDPDLGGDQRDGADDAYHQNNGNCLQALSPLEQGIVTHADNPIVKSLRVSYDLLDWPTLKICLLFLAIFPEKAVLKKKLLIYWWIGEGLVRNEGQGKKIFRELLRLEFIKPYCKDKCPMVSKFQIHPWIRYMLIAVAKEQKLLHLEKEIPCFNPTHSLRTCLISERTNLENETATTSSTWDYLRTIYNVSSMSLRGKPETLAKFKKLVVLQLGRWQASPIHQIQVLGTESFLRGLKTQKHLKYLSLRGISRITKLPDSIRELVCLEILDLKACHNLETLPDDISPLRRLTHLDVSECYMLEIMPKGLDKLTSLKVLKGFILGNSPKTPIRIEHLQKLTKLEQLGIHIARGPYLPTDLDRLKDLAMNVKSLKISWGPVTEKDNELPIKKENKDLNIKRSTKTDSKSEHRTLTFPPSLEKLKLEGIPSFSRTSEWLKPSQLRKLKKLYIKGVQLSSLDHEEAEGWKVEILLLKYTDLLQIDEPTAKKRFACLKYVKKVKLTMSGDTSGEESIDFEWSESLPQGSLSLSSP